jgi:hypothetical protein
MVKALLKATPTMLAAAAPATVGLALTAGPAAAQPPDPALKIPPDARGYQTAQLMMQHWQNRDHGSVPAVAPHPSPTGTKPGTRAR